MDNLIERTIIDVAVLCQEFANIEINCDNNNVITLDEIDISKKDFCSIFYPSGETFGINNEVSLNGRLVPYISFQPAHRSIEGKRFILLETILKNL